MKADGIVNAMKEAAKKNIYRFDALREGIPLGLDRFGEVVVAHREGLPERYHVTCVTGNGREDYLLRVMVWLAHIYDRVGVQFVILSTDFRYAPIEKLKGADVNLLIVRTKEEYEMTLESLTYFLGKVSRGNGSKKPIFVLDGLEEIPDVYVGDVTDPYVKFIDAAAGKNCEVLIGIDLEKSVCYGFPGAFVGIGNCLVSLRGKGKADLTRVKNDSSLGVPEPFSYPDEESIERTVELFNANV